MDRYLRHNDFLNLRKKEILYKKWLEDVSEPLLQKIEDKMGSQSSDEIEKRKEEQLALYLNYCKKKVSRSKFLSWKQLLVEGCETYLCLWVLPVKLYKRKKAGSRHQQFPSVCMWVNSPSRWVLLHSAQHSQESQWLYEILGVALNFSSLFTRFRGSAACILGWHG